MLKCFGTASLRGHHEEVGKLERAYALCQSTDKIRCPSCRASAPEIKLEQLVLLALKVSSLTAHTSARKMLLL